MSDWFLSAAALVMRIFENMRERMMYGGYDGPMTTLQNTNSLSSATGRNQPSYYKMLQRNSITPRENGASVDQQIN